MLHGGRYLFVLDGLEVLQHQSGDQFGRIVNPDLQTFLGFFAAPTHRVPLRDHQPHSFTRSELVHHGNQVRRPTPQSIEGRNLLRGLGVQGRDGQLDEVVEDWHGHALSLSLLSSYLVARHNGDVASVAEFFHDEKTPEVRSTLVNRILRRYDEHLTPAERAFLMVLSTFRIPVRDGALPVVFRRDAGPSAVNAPLISLDEAAFTQLIERLVDRYLLQVEVNPRGRRFMAHPLVRQYYAERLAEQNPDQVRALYHQIADFYWAAGCQVLPPYRARQFPYRARYAPTKELLVPWIELIHHACKAGAYDQAYYVMHQDIDDLERNILLIELGASDTVLAVVRDFFPEGDFSRDPLVSMDDHKSFLLNRVGVCLVDLGRLAEAAPFYERSIAIVLAKKDWHNASIDNRNLAALQFDRGALAAGERAAQESFISPGRLRGGTTNPSPWRGWGGPPTCAAASTMPAGFSRMRRP